MLPAHFAQGYYTNYKLVVLLQFGVRKYSPQKIGTNSS